LFPFLAGLFELDRAIGGYILILARYLQKIAKFIVFGQRLFFVIHDLI